jgi:hypothetical protein
VCDRQGFGLTATLAADHYWVVNGDAERLGGTLDLPGHLDVVDQPQLDQYITSPPLGDSVAPT